MENQQPEFNTVIYRRDKQYCLFVPDIINLAREYHNKYLKEGKIFQMSGGRNPGDYRSTIIAPIHCYSGKDSLDGYKEDKLIGFITLTGSKPSIFDTGDRILFINFLCTCSRIIFGILERLSLYKRTCRWLHIHYPIRNLSDHYEERVKELEKQFKELYPPKKSTEKLNQIIENKIDKVIQEEILEIEKSLRKFINDLLESADIK